MTKPLEHAPDSTAASPQQGAAEAELLFAYLFDAEGIGRALAEDDAIAWLAEGSAGAGKFLWLHFSSPHGIGKRWLQYVGLRPAFRNLLHSERRAPHFQRSRLGLVAVFNDVDHDQPSLLPAGVATLWVSVHERWLLSAQSAQLRTVVQLRDAVDAGQPLHGPLAWLAAMLLNQADALAAIVRTAAASTHAIEAMLAADTLPRRADLGGMRRDMLGLQRLLAPEPAALFRATEHPPNWADADDVDELYVATEGFAVVLRDLRALQDRVRLLEEEIAARVGERSSRALFVLAVLTVVALPTTVIGTLFGMNVGGLPFRNAPEGFWTVVLVSVFVTVVAAGAIARMLRR